MDLVDPTLHLNEEEGEDVQRVIRIALLCIQMASEKRPTMARVVSMLQSGAHSEVGVVQEAGDVQPFPSYRSQESGLTTVTEESGLSSYGFSSESQHILRDDNNRSDVELRRIRARW
jgi:hypothetical protein